GGGRRRGRAAWGGGEAWARKHARGGTVRWPRQFGSAADDSAFGVAADASGLYVAGDTNGTLPGQASAGGDDAFVRKYDAAGNELWTRQFGTSPTRGGFDSAAGAAGDASGACVAGTTGGTLRGQATARGL